MVLTTILIWVVIKRRLVYNRRKRCRAILHRSTNTASHFWNNSTFRSWLKFIAFIVSERGLWTNCGESNAVLINFKNSGCQDSQTCLNTDLSYGVKSSINWRVLTTKIRGLTAKKLAQLSTNIYFILLLTATAKRISISKMEGETGNRITKWRNGQLLQLACWNVFRVAKACRLSINAIGSR